MIYALSDNGMKLNLSQIGNNVTYFHGGAPGLVVGDSILPRNQLPVWREYQVNWRETSAASLGDLGDTVSLTTEIAIAIAYAGEYLSPERPPGVRRPGQVYEVVPQAEVQMDPDFPASFPTIARCEKGARVAAVHNIVQVEMNPRVIVKALGQHFVYLIPGYPPVYDADGYIQHLPEWTKWGAEPSDLRKLGPWMPWALVVGTGRFKIPDPFPSRI
ncbi:hypothetical protein MT350_19665 [Rathayibacter sp. VKM Ac-2928]|nr:hypothetical protein [Rathayibacter sp. VKM Ac-2928]